MSLLASILVVILVLSLIGSLPVYGYSRGWGWFPSGVVGSVLVVVLAFWWHGDI